MSTALLVLSIIEDDGMALLATILLSLVATLIGIGSRWSLKLGKRLADRTVPPSDVVINYPNGAFLIIRCNEDIARELYFAPEQCDYDVGATWYRVLSLIATIMLMFGVIFLGNASLTLQVCFAAAYLILNAAYWTVAALPQQWNWDLSCFNVKTIRYRTGTESGEEPKTFTEALWKAIAITQSKEWVMNARISPMSDAWRRWLDEGGEVAGSGSKTRTDESGPILLPEWDPNGRLTFFLNDTMSEAT